MKFQNDYEKWIKEPTRAKSGEVDFGANWLLHGQDQQPQFPRWRVSWIADTGELYAVELTRSMDRFIPLSTISDRSSVENALDGWATYGYAIYQNIAALLAQIVRMEA